MLSSDFCKGGFSIQVKDGTRNIVLLTLTIQTYAKHRAASLPLQNLDLVQLTIGTERRWTDGQTGVTRNAGS